MSRGRRLIPRKYTNKAYYTSLFMIHLALVSFRFQEYLTSFLAICLFITTNLHWKDVRERGVMKELDKIVVKMNFIWSIYAANKYDCRFTYYIIMLLNIGGFFINEYLNSRTLNNFSYMKRISLSQRKLIYIRACAIHMFILHFIQCELGVWVLYNCQKVCRPSY
jgi:hypothetical protein